MPFISDITYVLPETRLIEGAPEIDLDHQTLLTSIGLHSFAITSGTAPELLGECIQKFCQSTTFNVADIEAVMIATHSFWDVPEADMDANVHKTASMRNKHYKVLNQNGLGSAVPIGLFLGGSGNFGLALTTASNMVETRQFNSILVACIDRCPKDESRLVPPGVSVLSDSAACCLITVAPQPEKIAYAIEHLSHVGKPKLVDINAQENFIGYLAEVADSIATVFKKTFEATAIDSSQVKMLFTNNYGLNTMRVFAHKSGVPINRIYTDNIARFGHAFSADNLINLKDYEDSGDQKVSGDRLLLLSTGPVTWTAALLRVTGATAKDELERKAAHGKC